LLSASIDVLAAVGVSPFGQERHLPKVKYMFAESGSETDSLNCLALKISNWSELQP
jgi:hypothetical protein